MQGKMKHSLGFRDISFRRKGLTLVELIVMIFFIIVVSAILIPALGPHSRRYAIARQMQCQENLREIGHAFNIYRREHNNQWPLLAKDADYTQPSYPDISQADTIWDENSNPLIGLGAMQNVWILIESGLLEKDIFQCPSDESWIKRSTHAPYYGWGSDDEYSYGMHAGYEKFYGQKNPAALTEDTAGDMVIMSDQNKGNITRYTAYRENKGIAPANHSRYGVSYLLCDGAVEWYQWDESFLDGLPVGPNGDNAFTTENIFKPDLPIHPKDCYIVPQS